MSEVWILIQKVGTMTRKSTAVFIALATLTLAGFFAVSSVITSRKRADIIQPPQAATQPAVTPTPQATASPQGPSAKVSAAEAQLRADLTKSQALLDQLNADITAGAWEKANGHFTEFDLRTRLLTAPQLNHPDISPVMQDFFTLYKVQLGRALGQQDAQQARFAANQLFGIVGEQRARLGTRGVPLEFQRLHFLIREVEIWNSVGDQQMLRVRAVSLRDAWKEIRPVVTAKRNGPEQANKFDALIERLSAFDQTQDMSTLISNLGKSFEEMSALFQRATRQSSANANGDKPAEND
jgi:hypothetical protein